MAAREERRGEAVTLLNAELALSCSKHDKRVSTMDIHSNGCNWNCIASAATQEPLAENTWFFVQPRGSQVGVGVTTDPNKSKCRFNDCGVGFYYDAKTIHHNKPEEEWKAQGYNVGIKQHLTNGTPDGRLGVAVCGALLALKFPQMQPITFPLPESMRSQPLYGTVQVWNGCSATAGAAGLVADVQAYKFCGLHRPEDDILVKAAQ